MSLALDSSAPHYKDTVALVMAAYTTKVNTIDVYVTDSCNYFNNAQDINSVKAGSMPW